MAQGIRPTQYVTTFGPGAIVETPDGPFILKSIDNVLEQIKRAQETPHQYSISDLRLQRGLLQGGRVFRIPDEAMSRSFMHPTRSFPFWNLCVKHSTNIVHYRNKGCPICSGSEKDESKRPKYAIRFVAACPSGHLSDINWNWMVHRGVGNAVNCRGVDHFLWHGTGSSLANINIQCPNCNVSKTLGEIYQVKQSCRGYYPERDAPPQDCDQDAMVVQRGSTHLRVAEVITSLTIPPARAIHNILQTEGFTYLLTALKALGESEESFNTLLNQFVQNKKIPRSTAESISSYAWDEIKEAIEDIEDLVQEKTITEYLIQEHKALENAADTGYPPHPSEAERRIGEPPRFQINEVEIRKGFYVENGIIPFRIVPIERLRTVLVQKAYRRVKFDDSQIQPTSVAGFEQDIPDDPWYPGVDHFGEGIYIDIDKRALGREFYPTSGRALAWDEALEGRRLPKGDDSLIEWNALSVWWHTLAHRLINALSIHSGYSSTAIRERVYMTRDDRKGLRGAIILYTTQAGGDGTLGGLTSLVPQFEEIFRLALETINNCSNDPLCEDTEIDSQINLGSACYSCQMVSETSCEHMNGYLDRRLLLEDRI